MSKKICIVDDDKMVNDFLVEVLGQFFDDIEIEQYFDIPENRNDLCQTDLLIVDYYLPLGQFCSPECIENCETKKILITGSREVNIAKYKNICLIRKPFSIFELVDVISDILQIPKKK